MIVVFISSFILGLGMKIAHSPAGIIGASYIAFFTTLIALISMFVWGIPVHVLLCHFKRKSILWYGFLGFIPGIVLIFGFDFFGNDGFPYNIYQSLMLGGMGSFIACVFWYFIKAKDV